MDLKIICSYELWKEGKMKETKAFPEWVNHHFQSHSLCPRIGESFLYRDKVYYVTEIVHFLTKTIPSIGVFCTKKEDLHHHARNQTI